MAFEIIQPDVGTRLLRTFGAISEENRRKQELSQKMQALEMKSAQSDFMERIRLGQLGIAQQRADQSGALGLLNLQLRTEAEKRLAQQAGVQMLKDQQKLDATAADEASEVELAGLLNAKDESGMSLSQRLQSTDEKIAGEAMNAFAELSGRYAGAGQRTLGHLKFTTDLLSKNRQDQLARIREDRMAKSAADSAARFDRAAAERERHNKVTEGAAANKAQSNLTAELTRARAMALRQQITSETMQYENLGKEILKTKDPNKRKALEDQRFSLGRKVDEKKAEVDRITKLPDGPRPEDMFGGNAELPPVPADAVTTPAQPSIQVVPQSASAPVSPTAPLQNQAPPPTQADVTGLDFIFSRPSR